MAAVQEAKVAGKLAFDVINHKPAIDCNEQGTKLVTASDMKGHIEF